MPETASAPAQAVAAPHPLSPNGGERVDALTVEFSWSAVPGAEDYVLEVASDGDFKEPLVSLHTGPTTSVTLYDSLPAEQEQEVHWRVRAADRKAWGPAGHFRALDPEALFDLEAERAAAEAPPAVHPEWEARRAEATAALSLEDREMVNPTQVALVLGVIVVSFVLLLLVLLFMGQVTFQGEVFPN